MGFFTRNAPATRDADFADSVDTSDSLTTTLRRPDTVDVSDALQAFRPQPADSVDTDDAITLDSLDATAADTVNTRDATPISLALEPSEDCYLDRDDPTAAHDGTTMLAKTNTAVVNDDKNAYIAFDLTGISGVSAGDDPDGHVTLRVSHDGVGSQNLAWEAHRSATKPFEEETATWDADEPITGTGMTELNSPVSISAGAAQDYDFDVANIGDAFGEWVWLRVLGNTGVGGDLVTFTIVSREGANAPSLALEGKVP